MIFDVLVDKIEIGEEGGGGVTPKNANALRE